MQQLLKDKKKIGILIILIIVIAAFAFLYLKSGFRELKKNDKESIFVDSEVSDESEAKSANKNLKSNNNGTESKETTIPVKDKSIVVEIKGEVKKPDVYMLDENAIIKDLIEKAGGLTENADISSINRAKKLQNHELIFIANKNETNIENQNTNSNLTSNNKKDSSKKVNINSATIEELKTLNGVGDSKAKSIIEYREQNGGFKTIDDIKNVTGIGEKMFERIKEQIQT
jgi:competence protein ComEA